MALKGEHRKPEYVPDIPPPPKIIPEQPLPLNQPSPEMTPELPLDQPTSEIIPDEPLPTNQLIPKLLLPLSKPIPNQRLPRNHPMPERSINQNPPMMNQPLHQEIPRPPETRTSKVPNIMNPTFRPSVYPQPQTVIDISKKHPIDVRLEGYLPHISMQIQNHL